MAEKEIKKTVHKGSAGKKRRLKRSVRRTLGALSLAAAIAVAAIPTDGLRAASEDWGTLAENMKKEGSSLKLNLPEIKEGESGNKVYTTGDGLYQFVCVQDGGDYVAVLLGYTGRSLTGNALEIPEKVGAYANISANLGTTGGYTAVSKNNEFLYYPVYTWEDVPDPDAPEQTIHQVKEGETKYLPCLYSDYDKWYYYQEEPGKRQGAERDLSDFYYYTDNSVTEEAPKPASTEDHQWMKALDVRYIGNNILIPKDNGTWEVGAKVTYATREQGVFANNTNIVSLTVHDTLQGIGDYAFYNCGGLSSITLANGLSSIGVGAFANCVNMTNVNLDVFSNVSVIGGHAFYYCMKLSSFSLPVSVVELGDSAFEHCNEMTSFITKPTSVDPSGQNRENNVLLSKIGKDVFKDCSSLNGITIPILCTGDVPISIFAGCTSLKYIEVLNDNLKFVSDAAVDFEKFKSEVPAEFYFKGTENAAMHKIATDNEIAYSFYSNSIEKDIYEKTVGKGDTSIIYQVDDSDNLVSCQMGNSVAEVDLPEAIGPRHIKVINSLTFRNNSKITKVTVPSSLEQIESDAFKGCYNLKTVIFANGSNPQIGAGAFKTQEYQGPGGPSSGTPELQFVGNVSYGSHPFEYAMSASENINSGSQPRTYITYYSGWPSLLEVRYNPDKDENELINYPTFNAYTSGDYSTYPSLNSEQTASLSNAVNKYGREEELNEYEQQAVDAVLNLVLPDGIESIQEGLFVENERDESSIAKNKSITALSLKEVDAEAFKGHENLVSITLSDATSSIGDHAFDGCKKLAYVSLPATVSQMGLRPFAGCSALDNVNFGGGPYFSCENSMIFELADGQKDKLVEVLEGKRSPMVDGPDLAGITQVYEEAFKGTNLVSVDLSQSSIDTVPSEAFAETSSLTTVTLPRTIKEIADNAFRKSGLKILRIPGDNTIINEDAFGDVDGRALSWPDITFICEEGSMAERYAKNNGLMYSYQDPEYYCLVTFYDYYGNQLGDTQEVKWGDSAVEPEIPQIEGYEFVRWSTDEWRAVASEVLTVNAIYERKDEIYWTVTYLNEDDTVFYRQPVREGNDAIPIQPPVKAGYVFVGWRVVGGESGDATASLTNIQSDITVRAVFRAALPGEGGTASPDPGSSASPDPGGSASPSPGAGGSASPSPGAGGTASPSPGTNGSASPSPGTNGSASPSPGTNSSASPSPGAAGTFYTLTVQNGSGSGSYLEGSQPVIIANDPASGQEFDYWSVSPEDVKIASKVLSASIVTMPAKDVTVTAHYKAKTGSSGGGYTGSGNSSQRPNGNSVTVNRGGTTVVIDKNGLSNTGVVSATVNGSSDNFTVKISESAEATEAALRALMAEYGDNLDNIKFFPMDISLYDSTGTTKITDTTGLSVSITLPLPDSLITYAGNNKVASVVNDRLERLSARFSTIQGVSCITFTAEHFSPYVIYVNTGDLSSGLVSDETPKTGDFIHPKWFLSIALACLSFILLVQRDTKETKKVKAKVRA